MTNVIFLTVNTVPAITITDIIAIIGILATLFISIWSLVSSKKSNRKANYINSITHERVNSLTELKEQVSKYLSLVSNPVFSDDNINKNLFYQEIDYRKNRVMLQLNIKSPKEEALAEELADINLYLKCCGAIYTQDSYELKINNIKTLIRINKPGCNGNFKNLKLGQDISEGTDLLKDFETDFQTNLSQMVNELMINLRSHFKDDWEKIKKETN